MIFADTVTFPDATLDFSVDTAYPVAFVVTKEVESAPRLELSREKVIDVEGRAPVEALIARTVIIAFEKPLSAFIQGELLCIVDPSGWWADATPVSTSMVTIATSKSLLIKHLC